MPLRCLSQIVAVVCVVEDVVTMSSGGAQMSTAQSSDVYIESHFGRQAAKQTNRGILGS